MKQRPNLWLRLSALSGVSIAIAPASYFVFRTSLIIDFMRVAPGSSGVLMLRQRDVLVPRP